MFVIKPWIHDNLNHALLLADIMVALLARKVWGIKRAALASVDPRGLEVSFA
jgi:hypothetical protein